MGFFTTQKPVVTKEEEAKALNELRGMRDENGNHIFTGEQHKYLAEAFREHMDSDAPGQYPGINQEEGAQVLEEMKKPDPIERDVQRRFGVKYGFNDKQVDAVGKVLDKYWKK